MDIKLKKYGKTGLGMAALGIGLGVASGLDSTGATGKLTKAMPAIGGIVGAGMVLDATKGLMPQKSKMKRKGGYW